MLTDPASIGGGGGPGGVGGGKDAGVEAVVGVVAQGDGLVHGADSLDVDDRPKDLLAAQSGLMGDVGKHGGFVEVGAQVGAGAPAGEHGGTRAAGVLHVGTHGIELLLGGERAHLDGPVESRSELDVRHAPREGLGELLVDGVLHVDAFDGDA